MVASAGIPLFHIGSVGLVLRHWHWVLLGLCGLMLALGGWIPFHCFSWFGLDSLI